MKNNKLLFFVATVMVALPLCGQNGYLDRFPDLKGDSIISRISDDGHYRITCHHSKCNMASFVVTDGTSTYNYPTSVCVENDPLDPNPVLNKGYVVKDMKVVGDTCWVCGSYWRETGQIIYTPQGLGYWEVERKGFLGYVLLSSMAAGSCPVWYVTIPYMEYLNKMVVYPEGIAAVGSWGAYAGLFVELTRNSNLQWGYRLGQSSFLEEQFRDITYAGEKIITLSRFNNPPHNLYFQHGMGLRYGTPGSFLATSPRVYIYPTWDVTGTSELDFDPYAPLVFDKTHNGEEVAIGYVCNPIVPMDTHRGKWVNFVIHSENDNNAICMYNIDNQRYRSIKDMSILSTDKMVVLLEDSLGNSVFRFFDLWSSSDKTLSLQDINLMSVVTFPSSTYGLGMYVGGHYPNWQKRLSCLYETELLSRINSWNSGNCAQKVMGSRMNQPYKREQHNVEKAMSIIHEETVEVKIIKFYPEEAAPERACTDVN